MSSGLRIRAPQDPDFDPAGPYPDHLYLYTGSVNSFQYAATRPLQWPPNTVGRYRNTDPVLVNYLIRLAVEKRGEEYLSFPQRALFDKIGIRTMVMETDPYGNFLDAGLRARVGARLGAARQSVPAGRRVERRAHSARRLRQVREHAGARVGSRQAPDLRRLLLDQRRRRASRCPSEAYYMAGAGGQTTLIIPSHDLVVVRLGHYKGAAPGDAASARRWRC